VVVAVFWSGGVFGSVLVWVLGAVLLDEVDAYEDVFDGDLLWVYAHCVGRVCAGDWDDWLLGHADVHEDHLRTHKGRLG